jgi:hypothetical protein
LKKFAKKCGVNWEKLIEGEAEVIMQKQEILNG